VSVHKAGYVADRPCIFATFEERYITLFFSGFVQELKFLNKSYYQIRERFMKILNVALVLGFIFPGLCFAQTQTGNASYNASKNGVTIAHSSMSFGTRVRVINLRNNREIIATVDGRIPVSDPRIADVSAEAGDAIGMSHGGYTEVRLEQLIHVPVDAETATAGPPERDSTPAVPSRPPEPAAGSAAAVRETGTGGRTPAVGTEPVSALFPPYLPPAAGVPGCNASSLCTVILVLLIIIALLLTAVLTLLLAGRPWWFWQHQVWARRHAQHLRRRRD
jgi:rare lipoprotein A